MQLSVNGNDIFVATGGKPFDPALPAVVMIHGAGFDHSAWALHTRWFAHHGYSVLAPDLPGHGRSAGPSLSTIAEMADWTAALSVIGTAATMTVGPDLLKAAEANDQDAIDMVWIWGLGFNAELGGSIAP